MMMLWSSVGSWELLYLQPQLQMKTYISDVTWAEVFTEKGMF